MKSRNRPASALHRYGLTHRGSLVHLALRSASASQPADRLDRVVQQIVTNLKQGKSASLPGLGRFRTSPKGIVRFEREGGKRRG